jgi:hypothetical protein
MNRMLPFPPESEATVTASPSHGLSWSDAECRCHGCQDCVSIAGELGEAVECGECGHMVDPALDTESGCETDDLARLADAMATDAREGRS